MQEVHATNPGGRICEVVGGKVFVLRSNKTLGVGKTMYLEKNSYK